MVPPEIFEVVEFPVADAPELLGVHYYRELCEDMGARKMLFKSSSRLEDPRAVDSIAWIFS